MIELFIRLAEATTLLAIGAALTFALVLLGAAIIDRSAP